MTFPFKWSLFRGHIHFWRVNDGLLVLRVLLRQSWAWHNQMRGRSASDKHILLQNAHKFRETKKNMSNNFKIWWEDAKKNTNTKKKETSLQQLFSSNICPFWYTYSFYLHIIPLCRVKKGVEKPRTQKDVGSNPLVGIEAERIPPKMPTFGRFRPPWLGCLLFGCLGIRWQKRDLKIKIIHGGFQKIVGKIPPNHPFAHRVFPLYYKPSILGYPSFGNTHMIMSNNI